MTRHNPSAAYALALQSGVQRARQQSGDDWEQRVEALNAVCLATRVLRDVVKVPTPTQQIGPTRSDGSFLAKRVAAATVDYMGTLHDGRSVYVEAKRASQKRLPLARIEPQQVRALTACDEAGGVAVLLVGYGPVLLTATTHAVPWGIVAGMLSDARGLRSLGAEELAPWVVPSGRPYLSMPWLLRRAS